MNQPDENRIGPFWWAALAALPVIVFLLRAIGFPPSVMDWDESLYLLQAREWLHGGWPLVAVWDMHPIGAPGLFTLAMGIMGESLFAIRMLGVVAVTATGWGLFAAVRAAGGAPALGFAAALIYAGQSLVLGGLSVNTEILFAPFTTAALALALRGHRAPGWPSLIAMGLLVGFALLIKPVAAAEGCLAFLVLVVPALWRRALPWRRLAGFAGAYAGLCALPTLAFGVLYWAAGHLDAYLDGSFYAPFRYSGSGASLDDALWHSLGAMVTLLWPFAFAALALVFSRRWSLVLLGLAWFAAATLAVAGPKHFFHHYFLLWLPPLSLLAAAGALALAQRIAVGREKFALALMVGFITLSPWRMEAAPRLWNGARLFQPDTAARIAALIAEELPPGEAIFVPNYQPVVYFLAHAGIPTRFPFPVHLTGNFARLADSSTDNEVQRILDTHPRFIVVDRGYWDTMRPGAAQAIAAALDARYELAYVFDDDRNRIELWRLKPPVPEAE